MTRRKVIFADGFGKYYVTPELMSDTYTAEWVDIMKLFSEAATLDDFNQATKTAQAHYISSITPEAEFELIKEITGRGIIADEVIYIGAECTVPFTGINSTRFKMTDENICHKIIVQFYEAVAGQLGIYSSANKFECAGILISENIQNKIYEAYEMQYPNVFKKNYYESKRQLEMILLNSCLQMEETLPENTVEIHH